MILAGIAGLVMTSGDHRPAYDIFHIVAGAIGLLLALGRNDRLIRAFNVTFGLIDLYQAAASFLHLFPEDLFRWTMTDDIVHIVLGTALVAIGLFADRRAGSDE